MTAPLTLAEQQAIPYAEKVSLVRRIIRRTWRNRQDLPEDERIAHVEFVCGKLMPGDAAGAARLFSEALLP